MSLSALDLYAEDIVSRTDPAGRCYLGVVIQVAGGMDDDDVEEDDDLGPLAEGMVRVQWLDAFNPSDHKLSDLKLVTRSFMLGDIVVRASDPRGQSGTVIGLQLLTDVESCTTKRTERNVDSRRLSPVVSNHTWAVHGGWLGRVDEFDHRVYLKFPDGATCYVERGGAKALRPVDDDMSCDEMVAVVPGMQVSASAPVFRQATWLNGKFNTQRRTATVTAVTASTVDMEWIIGDGTPPGTVIDGSKLTFLNAFTPFGWQLGDLAMVSGGASALGTPEAAGASVSEPAASGSSKSSKKKGKGGKKKTGSEGPLGVSAPEAARITALSIYVDVEWQDGSVQKRVHSVELCSVQDVGDHDFHPGDLIVPKPVDPTPPTVEPSAAHGRGPVVTMVLNTDGVSTSSPAPAPSTPAPATNVPTADNRVGVVLNCRAADRMCSVSWLDTTADPNTAAGDIRTEDVSVYEIIAYTGTSGRVGDTVHRVGDVPYRPVPTATPAELAAGAPAGGASSTVTALAGEVVASHRGRLHVTWSDGVTSVVWATEVAAIDEDVLDGMFNEGDEEDEPSDSGEGTSSGSQSDDESGSDEGAESDDASDDDEDSDAEAEIAPKLAVSGVPGLKLGGLAPSSGDAEPLGAPRLSRPGDAEDGSPPYLIRRHTAALATLREKLDPDTIKQVFGAFAEVLMTCVDHLTNLPDSVPPTTSDPPESCHVEGVVPTLKPLTVPGEAVSAAVGAPHTVLPPPAPRPALPPSAPSDAPADIPRRDSVQLYTVPDAVKRCLRDIGADGTAAESAAMLFRLHGSRDRLRLLRPFFRDFVGCSGLSPFNATVSPPKDEAEARPNPSGGAVGGSGVVTAFTSGEEVAYPPWDGSSMMVLSDVPADHAFISSPAFTLSKNFLKAMKRDWRSLQSGLPVGIKVHTYEARPALMRAVVRGPTGTPYAHAVFFFDISLPESYPDAPPDVKYLSQSSDQLNPNLYTSGRVCLSLLGTWAGSGSEKWTPDSTILQLLISIQGLILVQFPYFNEAGYEKFIGTEQGDHLARNYNESAFLTTVQSMAVLSNAPPKDFTDLCRAHFQVAGPKILAVCRALLANNAAGATSAAGHELMAVLPHPKCSPGFLHVLAKIAAALEAKYA